MKKTQPLTRERVKKYLAITKKALSQLKHTSPKNTYNEKIAQDFLNMATSYYSDAKHFYEKDELVDAFACINYAHGWLDCGARIGLFDVGGDDQLFTLYK